MIRVYLDSNVYRYLKKDESQCSSLLQKLKDSKDRLMFYYSYAHLSDLSRDKTDRKFEDLVFMNDLVDDNYLNLNTGEEIVNIQLYSPIDAFNNLDHTPIKEAINFNELFEDDDEFETPEIKAAKKLLKTMFEMPIGLMGFPNIDELSGGNEQLKKLLPSLNKDSTLQDLMQGMLDTAGNLFEDPSIWRELRNFSINSLNLKKFDIDITDKNFDEALKNTSLKKSFLEFVEDTFKHNKSLEKQREYNFFIGSYNCLNILGLDNEKSKKVVFSSFQNDAQHSYYAAHCDYLVSDDEQLLLKSKVLYNLFGIETNVLSLPEFQERIDDILKFKIIDVETHLNAISDIIKEDNIINILEMEEENKKLVSYDLSKTHFDFFNRLDLVLSKNGKPFFAFYNKTHNYSRFTSFKEFEAITNKIVKILGNDSNGNSEFTVNDRHEIIEGEWKGRIWSSQNITFCLTTSSNDGSLCYYYMPEFILSEV